MFVLPISPYVWSILILDYDLVYTSLLFSLCLSLATYLQNSNSLYTCFNLSFMCYPQHPLRPYRWHNVSNVLCRNTPWMMGTTLYEPAKSVCTIFWNTIFQTTILIKAELYDLSRLKGVYNFFFLSENGNVMNCPQIPLVKVSVSKYPYMKRIWRRSPVIYFREIVQICTFKDFRPKLSIDKVVH